MRRPLGCRFAAASATCDKPRRNDPVPPGESGSVTHFMGHGGRVQRLLRIRDVRRQNPPPAVEVRGSGAATRACRSEATALPENLVIKTNLAGDDAAGLGIYRAVSACAVSVNSRAGPGRTSGATESAAIRTIGNRRSMGAFSMERAEGAHRLGNKHEHSKLFAFTKSLRPEPTDCCVPGQIARICAEHNPTSSNELLPGGGALACRSARQQTVDLAGFPAGHVAIAVGATLTRLAWRWARATAPACEVGDPMRQP